MMKTRLLMAGLCAVLTLALTGCKDSQEAQLEPGSRPNILVIVADDLGYTDLGVFGSEISTPNIDKLAANGTILTNYYTAPLCSPTRAMLLSGTTNHMAGVGRQSRDMGTPSYRGHLSENVVTLATRLRDNGYNTYMSGKWHLGDTPELLPDARGFDRSFALLEGGASHWADMVGISESGRANYVEDGDPVESLPENFYSSIAYADKMIGYMREGENDGMPFFGYLAFTAPHWPIQALPEDIEAQSGRYDEGYDDLRQRRMQGWIDAGMAPADAELPDLPGDYVAWDSLSDEEQALESRRMEVYAAMVTRLDAEIGRVLDYLEETGQLDNTLVIFQSDNGAEGGGRGSPSGRGAGADNSLNNIGHPGSFEYLGPGWAEAGSAPFHLRKTFATEGGIRVPAIVSAPKLGVPMGQRDDSPLMVYDLAPTFLQLAGADPDAYADDSNVVPITGRSFLGLLQGDNSAARRGENDVMGWEHDGQAAIRRGNWKLVWAEENRTAVTDALATAEPGIAGGLPLGGASSWRLINLATDPAEKHDLSAEEPEILGSMLAEWDRYVAENGVIVTRAPDNYAGD